MATVKLTASQVLHEMKAQSDFGVSPRASKIGEWHEVLAAEVTKLQVENERLKAKIVANWAYGCGPNTLAGDSDL